MMPKTLNVTTLDRDTSARFNFIMQHATEADELDV